GGGGGGGGGGARGERPPLALAPPGGGGGGGGGRAGGRPPPPPTTGPAPPRAPELREQSRLAFGQGAAHARQHLARYAGRVAALGIVGRRRIRDRMQHDVVELGG